jgi:methylated-DNA-[protein]-cysteine S-methyltransferase
MTEFERKVLKATLKIPLGEVRTYKQIAASLGHPRAYRAVANALRKNPYPLLVPCHRVIGEGGNMRGYALGIKLKRDLIKFEKKIKDMLK